MIALTIRFWHILIVKSWYCIFLFFRWVCNYLFHCLILTELLAYNLNSALRKWCFSDSINFAVEIAMIVLAYTDFCILWWWNVVFFLVLYFSIFRWSSQLMLLLSNCHLPLIDILKVFTNIFSIHHANLYAV